MLFDKYNYNDQVIKEGDMGGQVACMKEERDAYRILVGEPEGPRPPEKHRHGSENNIKMVLEK
jgi:hypothetical protein